MPVDVVVVFDNVVAERGAVGRDIGRFSNECVEFSADDCGSTPRLRAASSSETAPPQQKSILCFRNTAVAPASVEAISPTVAVSACRAQKTPKPPDLFVELGERRTSTAF